MATNNSKFILSFDISVGGDPQGKQDFTQESVKIGKGADATLQIDDGELADLHAALHVSDDGEVTLLDLGSDGGTLLNGQKIENAVVKSGDKIQMGRSVFVLTVSQEAPKAAPTPSKVAPTKGDIHAPGGGIPRLAGEFTSRRGNLANLVLRTDLPGTEQVTDKGKPRIMEVVQVWGDAILDVKHLAVSQSTITVGPDLASSGSSGVSLFINPDHLPAARFVLAERKGAGVTVNFAEKFSGFIEEGQGRKRTTIEELIKSGQAKKTGGGHSIQLEAGQRAAVDIGGVLFFIQEVAHPKWVPIPFTENLDVNFLAIFALMTLVSLLIGIKIYTTPYDPDQSSEEIPDRFAELLIEEEKKPEIKKQPSGNPDAGEGAKAKGEEGKVGKKESKVKTAKGTKVAMNRKQMDKEIAESTGLLADMNQDSNMAALMGSGGVGAGVSNALGTLSAGNYGVQMGSGGLGGRGNGLGGGGSGEGLGGLGTKGRGTGGSGYGRGGGYVGKKGDGEPSMGTGDPIILGALDKSVIDRVIKSHLAEIRYCYNKELNKNPKLYGKIVIKFVIDKDGKVSSALTKTTSMNNAIVEDCMCSRFMRFQFPQPKGGGIVIVSYPFIFKAAG